MLEKLLELVTAWINFSLDFLRHPWMALAPHCGKGAVSEQLTALAAAGVGVSYLLVALLARAELTQDTGNFVQFLRSIKLELLPAALILCLFVLAIPVHFTAWLSVFIMNQKEKGFVSFGSLHDSINAMFALSAVYVPAATALVLVGARLLAYGTEASVLSGLLLSVATGFGFVIYAGLAFAAAHRWISSIGAVVGAYLAFCPTWFFIYMFVFAAR